MPSDVAGGLAVAWSFGPTVRAGMSTRAGGASAGPYAGLNLGAHVGDDAAAVQLNRQRWAVSMQATPVWLQQVHGTTVVDAVDVSEGRGGPADAVFSTQPGLACTVLVADCLPVLMADTQGRCVAAAHAGWRGLAAGVLENTLAAVCGATGAARGEVTAWLGPCIGPRTFEVGDDVREAFGPDGAPHFRPHRRRDGSSAWLADLAGLARMRLAAAGVARIEGGQWCTVEDADRFFSYRRDGVTGRLAASIARV